MPIDPIESHVISATGPIMGGFDIMPHDTNELPTTTRALMVTVAGDVAVETKDGSTLTLPALVPGTVYPVRLVRVLATGTTATGLKGLY